MKKHEKIHNNEVHKHEMREARDLKEHDRIVEIDTRKTLAEPKWLFLQTIYGRVVFKVTHIAFDKMEIIKMTEIYNLL